MTDACWRRRGAVILVLALLPAAGCESNCGDGVDDDGDGFVDCADFECFGDPTSCSVERDCSDSLDNDLDGEIDCGDPDCVAAAPDEERSCANGIDDDCDGVIDCNDPDCHDAAPPTETICTGGYDDDCDGLTDCNDPDCACGEICDNYIDDDHDGWNDCGDPDCAWDPFCSPESEYGHCADGWDNDSDALTDCDDPDCYSDSHCQWSEYGYCDDGWDNDSDGYADCADPDCFGDYPCLSWEVECADFWDNDDDGYTDCDDPDCFYDYVCTGEEVCNDGYDNDGDGYTDCADPDCSHDPACTSEEVCNDGHDNDGDGLLDCDDVDDCGDSPSCGPAPGYWELFSDAAGASDLVGHSLVFTPDAADPNGYVYSVAGGLTSLPIEPGSGPSSVSLALANDAYEEVAFGGAATVTLYEVAYASFFVSSNGFVTFGEGSASRSPSAAAHFRYAGVAGFRSDLNPEAGGAVVVDQGEDFVAVSYDGVRAVGSATPSTFQIVFWSDGEIEIHILSLALIDGLVGLSCEGGHVVYPGETDFLP